MNSINCKIIILVQILLLLSQTFVLDARKVGQILHLTDFHIDDEYNAKNGQISAFCHLANNSTRQRDAADAPAGQFGDHRCDAPKILLEYVLSEAKRILPKPDLIIWTGDNTPHLDFDSIDYAIGSTRWTSEAIGRYFGRQGTTILPTMGNHDFTPANFVPDQPHELYELTFNLWEEWIGAEQRDTFRQGGFYKFAWKGQIFVVLNTNMYYIYNHQKLSHPEDPAGQFAFLENELKSAKKNGQKVNIVGHIPPGAYEREFLKLMPAKYNARLTSLIVEYAPWTNWLLFGHLHTDTFRLVKDAEGKPVQVIFVSAAVSPFKTNNPAFRIYDYDTETMEILDIKNFYVDLDELNRGGPNTRMRLEYSYRDAYEMEGLRPNAFEKLLARMKTEEKTFRKYILNNSVQSNFTNPSHMERAYQLCAIEFLDYAAYSKCVEDHAKAFASSAKRITASAIVQFLLFLLTIFVLF